MGCSSSKPNNGVVEPPPPEKRQDNRPQSLPVPKPEEQKPNPPVQSQSPAASVPQPPPPPAVKANNNPPPPSKPSPPPPPPIAVQPIQEKKVEVPKKFTPNAGFIIICENEVSNDKLYLSIMHHSSIETFLSLEPKTMKIENAAAVVYYVIVISSNLFEAATKNEDKKTQICEQAISHINQLYNAHAKPNSYTIRPFSK